MSSHEHGTKLDDATAQRNGAYGLKFLWSMRSFRWIGPKKIWAVALKPYTRNLLLTMHPLSRDKYAVLRSANFAGDHGLFFCVDSAQSAGALQSISMICSIVLLAFTGINYMGY
jgi:hypothetical protein